MTCLKFLLSRGLMSSLIDGGHLLSIYGIGHPLPHSFGTSSNLLGLFQRLFDFHDPIGSDFGIAPAFGRSDAPRGADFRTVTDLDVSQFVGR